MNTATTNVKYTIESHFMHFDTRIMMYRIKRLFSSGGLDFIVCTDEQLELLGIQA